MIHIKPRFRGFICTAAHPIGCKQLIEQQVARLKQLPKFPHGPKKVLIIGASTGYGLATRMVATFASNADTIGVFLEKPGRVNRTATSGWYQTSAFERLAMQEGRIAHSVCSDSFADRTKSSVIKAIKEKLNGGIDLIVYSLAAPRRVHPLTKQTAVSVLKPIGEPFTSKTVDFHTNQVSELVLEQANDTEIQDTISVMGGEDLSFWIDALIQENLLAKGISVVAYSYVGPQLTHPIYRQGTVGRAKDHLEATVRHIDQILQTKLSGRALVSINKAIVTQSSSAIPVVPLYISLLYKIMKKIGTHEDALQHTYRFFSELLSADKLILDDQSRLRMDNYELAEKVQEEVLYGFKHINDNNLQELADIEAYRNEFFQLFGFALPGIDYQVPVAIDDDIPSIISSCSL